MLFSCFNRVHNAHSENGAQWDSRGSETRGHRDGSSLQNGRNGDCHELQGVCLRRTDEDAADIAQHRTDSLSAEMTRRHNDANVLALGAGITGPNLAKRIVEVFLNTEFEGGRHARRVGQLDSIQP